MSYPTNETAENSPYLQLLQIQFPEYFTAARVYAIGTLPKISAELLYQHLFSEAPMSSSLHYVHLASTIKHIDTMAGDIVLEHLEPMMFNTDHLAGVKHLPFRYPNIFPWCIWARIDKYSYFPTNSYEKSMMLDLIQPDSINYPSTDRVLAAKFALAYAHEDFFKRTVSIQDINQMLNGIYKKNEIKEMREIFQHGLASLYTTTIG